MRPMSFQTTPVAPVCPANDAALQRAGSAVQHVRPRHAAGSAAAARVIPVTPGVGGTAGVGDRAP